VNNLSIAIVHFSVYLFSIDILKFSKRIDVYSGYFYTVYFIPYYRIYFKFINL
jgi:hypothetical protein